VEDFVRIPQDEDEAALKTSRMDEAYLAMRLTQERNKVLRLRENLHFIDDAAANLPAKPAASSSAGPRHTVFVDDEDAVEDFDPVEYFDTTPDAISKRHNRPRRDKDNKNNAAVPLVVAGADMLGRGGTKPKKSAAAKMERYRARQYRELSARDERLQKMQKVYLEMGVERAVRDSKGKGGIEGKIKVKARDLYTGDPAVYRFKQVRKR